MSWLSNLNLSNLFAAMSIAPEVVPTPAATLATFPETIEELIPEASSSILGTGLYYAGIATVVGIAGFLAYRKLKNYFSQSEAETEELNDLRDREEAAQHYRYLKTSRNYTLYDAQPASLPAELPRTFYRVPEVYAYPELEYERRPVFTPAREIHQARAPEPKTEIRSPQIPVVANRPEVDDLPDLPLPVFEGSTVFPDFMDWEPIQEVDASDWDPMDLDMPWDPMDLDEAPYDDPMDLDPPSITYTRR